MPARRFRGLTRAQGDPHTAEALLAALQTHARSITEAAAEVDRQLLTLRHGKG